MASPPGPFNSFLAPTSAGAAQRAVLLLDDEAATERLAAEIAAVCRAGDVIHLIGDLGAGKTALARGLIRSLAGDPRLEVPSPTFTLVQTYPAPAFDIWHFDLYRTRDPEEVRELGLDDSMDGLALIEWPERLGPHTPRLRLDIALSFGDSGGSDPITGPSARIAHLEDHHDWSRRLRADWS
ncbi:tRNA (adenosine(37)-N6)-threonylcarbamoyltransferase complex ATPase subunit type 1 TsaE [bacterium]|nr:tRNA (adenosine(37)-N6)-threonylcarbamoyltransferase complex ATPase subunit type 1 TsaE [bacterium]